MPWKNYWVDCGQGGRQGCEWGTGAERQWGTVSTGAGGGNEARLVGDREGHVGTVGHTKTVRRGTEQPGAPEALTEGNKAPRGIDGKEGTAPTGEHEAGYWGTRHREGRQRARTHTSGVSTE